MRPPSTPGGTPSGPTCRLLTCQHTSSTLRTPLGPHRVAAPRADPLVDERRPRRSFGLSGRRRGAPSFGLRGHLLDGTALDRAAFGLGAPGLPAFGLLVFRLAALELPAFGRFGLVSPQENLALAHGGPERALGIDAPVGGLVDLREQCSAPREFARLGPGVRRHRARHLRARHLRARRRGRCPIGLGADATCGSPSRIELLGAGESGLPDGDAVVGTRPLRLLVGLRRRPESDDLVDVVGTVCPEHVGVTPHGLLGDVTHDVGEVERPRGGAGGQGAVQDHLVQHVPELFPDVVRGAVLDRLDELVGLFDEVGHQGPWGLRTVPGAAALVGEEGVDHADELVEPSARPGFGGAPRLLVVGSVRATRHGQLAAAVSVAGRATGAA
ncbi:hypothetical protein FRIGORI9N_380008 [Frigoribacterium sp. 9N]|nr:hypothetical protein FRIGORI9N_380008 [Frigoribacterium sp. 9N]